MSRISRGHCYIFILWDVPGYRYETENRTGHPRYPAVQLRLTSHQWGLRFVPALFKQEGNHVLIIPPAGNASHEIGIFKCLCNHLVILSLCPHFLFDSSFRRAFCNLWQSFGPQWFARHHRVLESKVILTTIFDRTIPRNCALTGYLSFDRLQFSMRSVFAISVLWIALEIFSCRRKGIQAEIYVHLPSKLLLSTDCLSFVCLQDSPRSDLRWFFARTRGRILQLSNLSTIGDWPKFLACSFQEHRTFCPNSVIFIEKKWVENRLWGKSAFLWGKKMHHNLFGPN